MTAKQIDPKQYEIKPGVLAGKVILVTGAGDGIGREAAKTYAACGATVILLGRTVKKLEAVYDEIVVAGGPEPAIVPLDMKGATKSHYQGMAAIIIEQFGKLDGVLQNAGVLGVLSPFEHIDHDSWHEIMQVNVTAQFMMMQRSEERRVGKECSSREAQHREIKNGPDSGDELCRPAEQP